MEEIEFEITDIYEKNGLLNVFVETNYGKNNFGFDINQKYLHPVTKEPRFMKELRAVLNRKYGMEVKKEVPELEKFKGKKFKATQP